MAVRGIIDGENFQGNVSVFACLGVWSSCVRTKGGWKTLWGGMHACDVLCHSKHVGPLPIFPVSEFDPASSSAETTYIDLETFRKT